MKKLIISISIVIIIMVVGYFAGSYGINEVMKPALNGNEKVVSKSLDKDGKPKDVIGEIPGIDNISKSLDEAYVSVKVNHRSFKKGRVTLEYYKKVGDDVNDKEIIDDVNIDVSKEGYISYHIDNIKDRENGRYGLAFYDDEGDINVYAGFDIID